MADQTKRDEVFSTTQGKAKDFEFDGEVADVFDDMLGRSVPFYAEIQRMCVELAQKFWVSGTRAYDLGCSTGTTFLKLGEQIKDQDFHFIGYDTSAPMLEKARKKLERGPCCDRYTLQHDDIVNAKFSEASVVFMLFTLQFVRPLHRDELIRRIYDGLVDGGCLLLAEKVLAEDTELSRLFIEVYYDFKRRNHYSDLEITQKREALENVLVPYRVEENLSLLRRNGFELVDVFFKWYNFSAMIAIKHPTGK